MNEAPEDTWRFRRNERRTNPLNDTFHTVEDDLHILVPKIVLLYKAEYPDETKSEHDFRELFLC